MASIDDAESDNIKGGFVKNEIVEKDACGSDRRGALSGQRGRDWHAERDGKRGNGAVGECGRNR